MASREGQVLGKYRLVRLLGYEALGDVYLAEDVQYRHRVSIIVLEKHFDRNIFFEQGRKLAQLKHPNIVQLQDFGVEGSWPFFLVFNHTRATSLRDRHPKGSVLSPETIVSYAKQMAAALHYAHTAQFTNLFVQPEHMFIGKNSEIVLSGFESVFADWDDGKQDIGSDLAYMAPEFIRRKPNFASDQYSLATVVYEWLCGSPPFIFDDSDIRKSFLQIVKEPPPSMQQKNTAIPNDVAQIVMKALAKRPEDRFESIQAFAEAFVNAYPFLNLVGQPFGNYRLTKFLGRGNSGDVYLGEHSTLGSKAAIKVLRSEFDNDEFRSGIQRIAKLSHQHIMRITNFGVKDTTPFLVMEYAASGTILQKHPEGTTIPLQTVVNYVQQIAAALEYAHNHNVVHGHLTPADILLKKEADILLSGFNPLTVGQSITQQPMTGGIYTPPELLVGTGTLLPASDQYALAAIVYEWLSGKAPSNTAPTPLGELLPKLPLDVERAVMKALNKVPRQRFSTIQKFADALAQKGRGEQQLGDYDLKLLLGQGGFADVYLGQHRVLGTYAAVKVLKLDRQMTEKDKKQFKKQFQKEATTIAKLEHNNIVRILDCNIHNDTPFLVMEYYEYGSLRSRYPRDSRLPLSTILSYVKQVAEALQYAHNKKVIHRDVKPDNLLIGPNQEILLSDFGLAIVAHSTNSLAEQDKLGTIRYMAPEQFKGEAVVASDQYSLAVMTYEWLCGSYPFDGSPIQIVYQVTHDNPPSLQEKDTNIPEEVQQVIFKALAKKTEERYSSVQAYADALEKAIETW